MGLTTSSASDAWKGGGIEVLDECRRRLADAADLLAEFRGQVPAPPVVVTAEAKAAAELVDRALFAVDRARACQRRTIVRQIAQARIDGGGDRFLLSHNQARIVATALGSPVPAIVRLASTGEIRRSALEEIRTEIERVVDSVVAGRHAVWEFGALRALEIYVQRHHTRPPVPGWPRESPGSSPGST